MVPMSLTSAEVSSILSYQQGDHFSNKKEWIDILKKNTQLYHNEEKNLVTSFLSQDFHLQKLYKNYLEEENAENTSIKESIKVIKNQIVEAENIFKGVKLVKNKEIRNKISKLEEGVLKVRQEFKTKFESLLNEEETLEREILEIQDQIESGAVTSFPQNYPLENVEPQVDNKEMLEDQEPKTLQNNFVGGGKTAKEKGISLEKIFEQIENDRKYFTYVYSKEDVEKYSLQFEKLDDLKDLINKIENKILEVGGPTQGWENKDHQEFLKLRTQHKNKINTLDFLSDFENALPYLTRGDLKLHINLFIKFDRFNNIKKIFLDRYKSIKDQQDDQKKKIILEKVDKEEKQTKQKMKEVFKSNEDKKRQVEEWKKQKERENLEKQNAKFQQEVLSKEKDKQKFNEIIEKNKVLLEEYYKNKEIERLEKDLQETTSAQNRKQISDIDLERINERNQNLEERRKLVVKSKSTKVFKESENYKKYQMKRIEKLAKVESKLDYKTTAVTQKQRLKHDYQNNKDASTMANNVLGRMCRAVPDWRKPLV